MTGDPANSTTTTTTATAKITNWKEIALVALSLAKDILAFLDIRAFAATRREFEIRIAELGTVIAELEAEELAAEFNVSGVVLVEDIETVTLV